MECLRFQKQLQSSEQPQSVQLSPEKSPELETLSNRILQELRLGRQAQVTGQIKRLSHDSSLSRLEVEQRSLEFANRVKYYANQSQFTSPAKNQFIIRLPKAAVIILVRISEPLLSFFQFALQL